jgi:hypothetical protein
MEPENTGIGLLAQLPREVRDLIWEYFVPSEGQQTNLGILQTCHQLYEEVSPLVYQNQVLQFHISPNYQYQSWLSIMTRQGAELHLRDLQDATSRGFLDLLYKKLEAIKIEIKAPAWEDPGQIVCLWKKVTDLVDFLSQVGGLPDVEVHLQDSERAKWSTEGKPQQCIPQYNLFPGYDHYEVDFEAILLPFCRLRNVPTASVHTTENIKGSGNLIENYALTMMMEEPFGKALDDSVWSDDYTQQCLDTIHFQFDDALDDLPGYTARMMRLDRFSSWYTDELHSESKYLRELERIYHGKYFTPDNSKFKIEHRYRLMLTFNPMSGKMQEIQCLQTSCREHKPPYLWDESEWRSYRKLKLRLSTKYWAGAEYYSDTEDEAGGLCRMDEWDRDAWHRYYVNGIPPLNSESTAYFHDQMLVGGSYPCEKAFLERFERDTDF